MSDPVSQIARAPATAMPAGAWTEAPHPAGDVAAGDVAVAMLVIDDAPTRLNVATALRRRGVSTLSAGRIPVPLDRAALANLALAVTDRPVSASGSDAFADPRPDHGLGRNVVPVFRLGAAAACADDVLGGLELVAGWQTGDGSVATMSVTPQALQRRMDGAPLGRLAPFLPHEKIADLIASSCETLEAQSSALMEAIARGEPDRIRWICHDLKSVSGIVGAVSLLEHIQMLGDAVRRRHDLAFAPLGREISRLCGAVSADLLSCLAPTTAPRPARGPETPDPHA